MLQPFEPIAFVHTTDVARAEAFYVGVLGLGLLERSPFALVVQAGPIVVRITPVETHAPSAATVLGWSVPDIATVLRGLLILGVTPLRYDQLDQDVLGIWQAPGGAQVAWFSDPDGNTLSLTQY